MQFDHQSFTVMGNKVMMEASTKQTTMDEFVGDTVDLSFYMESYSEEMNEKFNEYYLKWVSFVPAGDLLVDVLNKIQKDPIKKSIEYMAKKNQIMYIQALEHKNTPVKNWLLRHGWQDEME